MPQCYACLAGIAGGLARCRNEEGRCPHHNLESPAAPRPDTVLVKVNLNKHWVPIFTRILPTLQRSYQYARQLEGERVVRAEKLERNAYAVRDERDAKQTPESADSGCPVFGKGGLADMQVSIRGLIAELEQAGFVLTFANLLHRDWKPPIRLVLEFSKAGTKAAFEGFSWKDFGSLITTTTFDQVDVWANDADPRKGGRVVHTVNCGRRNDAAPAHQLHYENGDWAVESTAASANASA